MKYFSSLCLTIFITMIFSGCNTQDKPSSNDALDQKVAEVLQKMTLEEKVGQMTQLTVTAFIKAGNADRPARPVEWDTVKIDSAFNHYFIGSVLNVPAPDWTREEWIQLTSKFQKLALESGAKIPLLYGFDATHGAGYVHGATVFPHQIGMAATWSTDLAEQAGAITSYESKAVNVHWNFAPVLDVTRTPLWPRLYESFGEDTYLCGAMGEAYVKGAQGDDLAAFDKMAVSLKHYMGYGDPRSGKDRTPAWIPERYVREIFLPPFEKAIKAGAASVMINSGEINGIPVHSDKHILTDILKDELGFKGFAVTDWQDIQYLYSMHFIAHDNKEAVKMAVNAGVDMSMVPNDFTFSRDLIELVKEGEVPMSRIDDAVSRILRVKMQLGLFENPYTKADEYPEFAGEKFTKTNYDMAAESITLLKNDDNVLPLKEGKKVLVTGYTANSLNVLYSGWTHTWQGDNAEVSLDKPTILDGIKAVAGAENVLYEQGTSYDASLDVNAAIAKAKQADYIVACIGEHPYTENLGNINDLTLPKAQLDFVAKLQATGKPVILVLVEGRPRIIKDIVPGSKAIVNAYLPGYEGGTAIADALYGKVVPSGKLPYTYPQYPNNLVAYDHKSSDERHVNFGISEFAPQFEFGYGLSYTTFEYSDLQVDKTTFGANEGVTVSVKVKNIGEVTAKEVVQVYVKDHVASITPAVKRLKAFDKISLEPGEEKTVTINLSFDDFSFIGRDNTRIVEPGKFSIMVDKLVKEIECVK